MPDKSEVIADLRLVSNTLAQLNRAAETGGLDEDHMEELDGMGPIIDEVAHKYGYDHADNAFVEFLQAA